MNRPGKLLIAVAISVLCLIWGTTWAVIQIGLRGIPPFSGVALRFALAAMVLLTLAFSMGIKLGRTRRERLLWLGNGIFSFVISYGVVYWAEQWVPSSLAAVLFATYPFFVAVISHFVLSAEPLSLREVMGILLGFGGVVIIFSEDFTLLGGPRVLTAAAVMLVSPLAAAVGSVAVKRWGHGIHPISLTAMPMALTAAVMGAVAFGTERERVITWDAISVGALLYLAILGSAVTFTLYYWLLSHLPVKQLALITYLIPVVAVMVGVLRGEPLTLYVLSGAAVVILGVACAVHRPAPVRPSNADT